MQRIVYILFLVLACSGCASRQTVKEPDYERLLLENTVRMMVWMEETEGTDSVTDDAITTMYRWQTEFPVEDVISATQQAIAIWQDVRSSYVDILRAVREYTKLHTAYTSGNHTIKIQDLYQRTERIDQSITLWYAKTETLGKALEVLEVLDEKFNFSY
jgi:PBP1b-binding outer membrane lipoprotein LpoB